MKDSLISIVVALAAAVSVYCAPDCKNHPLLSPNACCTLTSPPAFNATFVTDAGDFTVYVKRSWAPLGADRFYSLIACHYFDQVSEGAGNEAGIFRVVPGFVSQFGIAGVPAVSAAWANLVIANDPVVLSNVRGTLAYAAVQDANGQAVNRTTQVYINLADNSDLDPLGFTPIGTISAAGMRAVDAFYSGYGQVPDQDQIYALGDAYLRANFPKMTFVRNTTWVVAAE